MCTYTYLNMCIHICINIRTHIYMYAYMTPTRVLAGAFPSAQVECRGRHRRVARVRRKPLESVGPGSGDGDEYRGGWCEWEGVYARHCSVFRVVFPPAEAAGVWVGQWGDCIGVWCVQFMFQYVVCGCVAAAICRHMRRIHARRQIGFFQTLV